MASSSDFPVLLAPAITSIWDTVVSTKLWKESFNAWKKAEKIKSAYIIYTSLSDENNLGITTIADRPCYE